MSRLAIVGSREYAHPDAVRNYIRSLPLSTTIVTGGALGVDQVAEQEARRLSIFVEVFLPDYISHGRRAPLVRNEQIAHFADEMRAFWNGVSTGTARALGCAMRLGKPTWVLSGVDSTWRRWGGAA